MTDMQVTAEVPERQVVLVKPGDTLVISMPEGPGLDPDAVELLCDWFTAAGIRVCVVESDVEIATEEQA